MSCKSRKLEPPKRTPSMVKIQFLLNPTNNPAGLEVGMAAMAACCSIRESIYPCACQTLDPPEPNQSAGTIKERTNQEETRTMPSIYPTDGCN